MATEENFINPEEAFHKSLQDTEVNDRLVRFVQILMQINMREKLVKYPPHD